MASTTVQSSVNTEGTSLESRQKIQRELMNECELTWEHIQQVRRLFSYMNIHPYLFELTQIVD